MLADTMMPEAFEHGGRVVGLMTTVGFGVAFFLHNSTESSCPRHSSSIQSKGRVVLAAVVVLGLAPPWRAR